MNTEILIAVLAGVTFIALIVFALRSRAKTKEMRDDPQAPKSALAKDGPTGPVDERT